MSRTAALVLVLVLAAPAGAASGLATGMALYLRGDYRGAAAALEAAVARGASPDALLWLGASYYRLQEYPRAAGALERYVRARPRAAVAWFWLGSARLGTGDLAGGTAALRYAAALEPGGAVGWSAGLWLRRMRVTRVRLAPGYARPGEYASLARAYNRALSPTEVDAVVRSVLGFSYRYRIDPRLISALIAVESGFSPRAVSPAGAVGLAQLMPDTARSLRVNPWSIPGSIYGAVRVVRGHLDRYGEDRVDLALAAYNAGRGAVSRYGGIPPFDETRWYVYNVLSLYGQFRTGEFVAATSP